MLRLRTLVIATSIALGACSQQSNEPAKSAEQPAPASTAPAKAANAAAPGAEFSAANPFYAPSTLPFQAPPFDQIKDGDYQPAFEEGMKQQLAEIATIADNPAPPTFDNTIVAIEKTGALLTRTMRAFNAVSGANTNDTLQKVQEAMAPKLAAHQDAIYLNAKLFARIKALYDSAPRSSSIRNRKRLVECYYQQFVHGRRQAVGGRQGEAARAEQGRVDAQHRSSRNQLLAATKAGALVVDDKAELAGLSRRGTRRRRRGRRRRASSTASGCFRCRTRRSSRRCRSLTNRATREKLFNASWTRAEQGDANDTRATIPQLAQLRAREGASCSAIPNYAAWRLRRPDGEDAGRRCRSSSASSSAPPRPTRGRGEAKRHPGR